MAGGLAMSAIRERFGDQFERFRKDGAAGSCYGKCLADCDKDELLAVIGYLAEVNQRKTINRHQETKS